MITRKILIGSVPLGAGQPVRLQTMTNTATVDVNATVHQIERIVASSADYVRITVQGQKELTALRLIKEELRKKASSIPLIADIHFNPALALACCGVADKVRINPGNFAEKNDDRELQVKKLAEACKQNNTVLRIGSNHGSLSRRIVDKYGDTAEGMAESVLEYLHLFRKYKFENIVVSMKASDTRMMVYATRLLAIKMADAGFDYPFHLGVTEAGEGEDGRIRSAAGIAALLLDGIGDTIRVSLTEPPENEIPVAAKLVRFFPVNHSLPLNNVVAFNRRETKRFGIIGGQQMPVVISSQPVEPERKQNPDLILQNNIFLSSDEKNRYLFYDTAPATDIQSIALVKITVPQQPQDIASPGDVAVIDFSGIDFYSARNFLEKNYRNNNIPVILKKEYAENDIESFQLRSAGEFGALLMDGWCDGIWLENKNIPHDKVIETAFGILQACRLRMSRTEYISCPTCGRTLFDIQKVVSEVKIATAHLTGLKIAVMGCIVNGPGEMADADYGYVGAGSRKVWLYKKGKVVLKDVDEQDALNRLIDLIKESGEWKE